MIEYVLIAAGVAFAAFCSGSEMGAYSVNRLRLRLRAEQGSRSATALLGFIRRPRLAVSTTLIGTNVGLYLATVLTTNELARVVTEGRAELLSGLLMPPVLLILAEVLPKSLFQHHADALMSYAVWPLQVLQKLLYPLVLLLRWVGGLPQMMLGRRTADRRPLITPEAFRFYLSEGAAHGALSPLQYDMTHNILRLKTVRIGQVMTPLDRAVMVPEGATPDELQDVMRAHRYLRVPVYAGGRDEIVGVVNVLDVACAPEGWSTAGELARGVMSVEQDTSVADALWALRQARQQFAVVTGPDGRAVGVATIEDLVEEIVGELEAW